MPAAPRSRPAVAMPAAHIATPAAPMATPPAALGGMMGQGNGNGLALGQGQDNGQGQGNGLALGLGQGQGNGLALGQQNAPFQGEVPQPNIDRGPAQQIQHGNAFGRSPGEGILSSSLQFARNPGFRNRMGGMMGDPRKRPGLLGDALQSTTNRPVNRQLY